MCLRKLVLILASFNLLLFSTFHWNVKTADAVVYSKVATKVATKAAKEIITDSAVNMAIEIVMNYEMEQKLQEHFNTDEDYTPVCLDKTDKCANPMQVKTNLDSVEKERIANEVESLLNQKAGMNGFKKFLDFFIPVFLTGLAISWITTMLDSDTESLFDEIAKESLLNTDIIKSVTPLLPRDSNMSFLIPNAEGDGVLNYDRYVSNKYVGSNTGRITLVPQFSGSSTHIFREYEFSDMSGVTAFSYDYNSGGVFTLAFLRFGLGKGYWESYWDDDDIERTPFLSGMGFDLFIGNEEIIMHPHDLDTSNYVAGQVIKNNEAAVAMTTEIDKWSYVMDYASEYIRPNALTYYPVSEDEDLYPLNVRHVYVNPKKIENNDVVTEVLIHMYSGDVYKITATTRPQKVGPSVYDKAVLQHINHVRGHVDVFMQIQHHGYTDSVITAPVAPIKPSSIPQNSLDSSIYKNKDGTVNILPPAAIPITPTSDSSVYVQPKPTPEPNVEVIPEWQRIDTKDPVNIDEDLLTVKDPIVTPDGDFEIPGTPDILKKPEATGGDEDPPKKDITEGFDEASCEQPVKLDLVPLTNTFTNTFPFSLPFDLKRIIDNTFGGIGDEKPSYKLTFLGDDVVLTIPEMIDEWMPFLRSILVVLFDISILFMFYRFMRGGGGE